MRDERRERHGVKRTEKERRRLGDWLDHRIREDGRGAIDEFCEDFGIHERLALKYLAEFRKHGR